MESEPVYLLVEAGAGFFILRSETSLSGVFSHCSMLMRTNNDVLYQH
jgi:hypothetical protein